MDKHWKSKEPAKGSARGHGLCDLLPPNRLPSIVPSSHTVYEKNLNPELGMMAHTCNSRILGVAERQEFKVIPCYRMSLRLDWDIWEQSLKRKKNKYIKSFIRWVSPWFNCLRQWVPWYTHIFYYYPMISQSNQSNLTDKINHHNFLVFFFSVPSPPLWERISLCTKL